MAEDTTVYCTYPTTRADGTGINQSEIKTTAWYRSFDKLEGRPESISKPVKPFRWNDSKCQVYVKDIQPGEYITLVVIDQQNRFSNYAEPYHHNPPAPAVIVP